MSKIPTDEQTEKILYWVMISKPTPKQAFGEFSKSINPDHWRHVSAADYITRRMLPYGDSDDPWVITGKGVEWLKEYETRRES